MYYCYHKKAIKRQLTGKGFAYEICCQGTDARQEKVYFDYTAADSFDVYGSVFVGTCHRLHYDRRLHADPQSSESDVQTVCSRFGNQRRRGRQAVKLIRNEVKNRSKAAVMVTHDERVLDLADRVLRLENGKLIDK